MRRRDIAVYQRDFKGRDDLKGSDAVKRGNMKAHEGDAVADGMIFDRDGNLDICMQIDSRTCGKRNTSVKTLGFSK